MCFRFGGGAETTGEPVSKEETNFGLSGKLTAETNMYKVKNLSFLQSHINTILSNNMTSSGN